MTKNLIHYLFLMATGLFLHACQTPQNTQPIGFCSQDCTKKLVGTTPEYLIQIGKTRLSDVVPDSLRDKKSFSLDAKGDIIADADGQYLSFWTNGNNDIITGAKLPYKQGFSTTKGDLHHLSPKEIEKILGKPTREYDSKMSKGSVPIADLLVYEYGALQVIFFLNKSSSILLGEAQSRQ